MGRKCAKTLAELIEAPFLSKNKKLIKNSAQSYFQNCSTLYAAGINLIVKWSIGKLLKSNAKKKKKNTLLDLQTK